MGGTATLYLLFGVTGAGYASLKMHRAVGELNDFRFLALTEKHSQAQSQSQHGLNVIICVGGWLEGIDEDADADGESVEETKDTETESESESEQETDDLDTESCVYWTRVLRANGAVHLRSDCYSLLFEKKVLLALGDGLKKFVAKRAVSGTVSTAATTTLGFTAFATLVTALTWPVALIAVAGYIDNPWTVALAKSKEAGLVLADCLATGNHGRRPVTLCGFSLGARVIYYALTELVRRLNEGESESKQNETEAENEAQPTSKFAKLMAKSKNKRMRRRKIRSARWICDRSLRM